MKHPSDSRRVFETAVERIDTATANRLRLMRRDALHHKPSTSRVFRGWAPLGAALTIGVVIGVYLLLPQHTPPEPQVLSDSLLLEEDPELMDWLADAPVAIEAGKGGVLQ